MFRNLQGWHLIILVVALVLLFGWKRLPDMARSMGQSMRVFKSEVDQMKDDNAPSEASSATVPGTPVDPRVAEAERLQAEADRLRREATGGTTAGSPTPPPRYVAPDQPTPHADDRG